MIAKQNQTNLIIAIRFECAHNLLVYWLLEVHSPTDRISFIGLHHFPKVLGQKGKSKH